MSDEQRIRALNEEYVRASLAADVALLRAAGRWTSKAGQPGTSRYVDVYARSGADWNVVSAQVTRPVRA